MLVTVQAEVGPLPVSFTWRETGVAKLHWLCPPPWFQLCSGGGEGLCMDWVKVLHLFSRRRSWIQSTLVASLIAPRSRAGRGIG